MTLWNENPFISHPGLKVALVEQKEVADANQGLHSSLAIAVVSGWAGAVMLINQHSARISQHNF